ncbi:MAG: ATP-binding protein [Planctomycetes bacterium]|nr:ATP-binding protein [Planctomycetota bacterium]
MLASALVALAGLAGGAGLSGWWWLRQRRRQAALVAEVARLCERAQEPAQCLPRALALLGAAWGCQRLELHRIHGEGAPRSSLLWAWAAEGWRSRLDDPTLRERPWHPERARLLAELSAGRCAAARPEEAGDLPECRAVLYVPIAVDGQLWGCLLRADRRPPLCRPSCTDAAQAIAALFAFVLARAHARQRLERLEAEAALGRRTKEEFLAALSHEVRTPLTAVLGMSGFLLDSELTAEQRSCAQTIRDSAENLQILLDDLIEVAKCEADSSIRKARCDPLRLAEDCAALHAELAQAKGVEIAVLPEDGLPLRVLADPVRLRQALGNLIANAVKFTNEGHVLVRAAWEGGEQGTLVYEVHDTGIGMDAATLERIREPLTQGDGSTTRRYGGLGLGLTVVRRAVAALGGHCACSSAPGQGTVFALRVPALRGSSEAGRRQARLPDEYLGRRCLLVEPNERIGEAYAAQCRALGLRVERCREPSAAAALLASDDGVQLLIIGMHLPGAAELVRGAGGVPCIGLCASHERFSRAELQRRGYAAALARPPRRARLREAVLRAFGEAESQVSELGTRSRQRRRLLVVSGDVTERRLIGSFLAREGFLVDTVADRDAARAACARAPYPAVLVAAELAADGAWLRLLRGGPAGGEPPLWLLLAPEGSCPPPEGCAGCLASPPEARQLRRLLRAAARERA